MGAVGVAALALILLVAAPYGALSQQDDDCTATFIDDIPAPIHKQLALRQKSAARIAMVGFTNRVVPGEPGFVYPSFSSDRIPVVIGEAISEHLATPVTFLRNCTADFSQYDVLYVRGCKCVTNARKSKSSLVIGSAKPHDFLHGHGGDDAPSAPCLRKLDFVISDNGTMKQRLEAYGTKSLQLKLVEKFPPPGVQHTPNAEFTMRKPAKICYHGNWNHFNNLRMRVLMGLNERVLGVPFEFYGITNGHDVEKARQAMSTVPYKTTITKFNDQTLFQELQDCDVGLVPQVRVVKHDLEEKKKPEVDETFDIGVDSMGRPILRSEDMVDPTKAGDKTDDMTDESVCAASVNNSTAVCTSEDVHWRFKMSHNAGRAFVFLQLGVPSIGEAVPEYAEVIGAHKLGISIEESTGAAWTHAIKQILSDKCLRKTYAERSRMYAEQHLRPEVEAMRLLLYSLKRVTNKKTSEVERKRLTGGDRSLLEEPRDLFNEFVSA